MNCYMKVAKELAEENLKTNAGGPFGACIVKDNQIIGRGSNQVLGSHDPTAHAEIVAIREASNYLKSHDLSGCDLYTTCYPCPMCLSAIIWANIKKVYYGNYRKDAANIGFRDDFIYEYIKTGSYEKNTDLINFEAMDRDETIKAFEQFAHKEDRTIY